MLFGLRFLICTAADPDPLPALSLGETGCTRDLVGRFRRTLEFLAAEIAPCGALAGRRSTSATYRVRRGTVRRVQSLRDRSLTKDERRSTGGGVEEEPLALFELGGGSRHDHSGTAVAAHSAATPLLGHPRPACDGGGPGAG